MEEHKTKDEMDNPSSSNDVEKNEKAEQKEEQTVPKKKYRIVRGITMVAVAALIFIAGLTLQKWLSEDERSLPYSRNDVILIWRGDNNSKEADTGIEPEMETEVTQPTRISEDRARQIALDANEGATFSSIKLLVMDDTYIYVVTLKHEDGTILNVYIDALTGGIIKTR